MVQKKEKFMNLLLEYVSTKLNYVFDSCLSVYSVSQTKPPADPAERERIKLGCWCNRNIQRK